MTWIKIYYSVISIRGLTDEVLSSAKFSLGTQTRITRHAWRTRESSPNREIWRECLKYKQDKTYVVLLYPCRV